MITVLLAALALTAVTVLIHGLGAVTFGRHVATRWATLREQPGRLAGERMITLLVSALLVLHLAEALVWAAFLVLLDALPDLETAAYFSLTSYTTLGYGDVTLPREWRLLGPLEGAAGVLMFGWSTGILAAALNQVYRRAAPPAGAASGRES
jgi:hypothetical protein